MACYVEVKNKQKNERKRKNKTFQKFTSIFFKKRYGLLGLLESIVKVIAFGVAIASLSAYSVNLQLLPPIRIAQLSFMCICGAIFIALIVHRILDKEIFSLIFMIVQTICHWVMTIVVPESTNPSAFLFTYIFLMLLGELIKLMYIFCADIQRWPKFMDGPNGKLILAIISGVIILCEVIIMILQIVIWLLYYQ